MVTKLSLAILVAVISLAWMVTHVPTCTVSDDFTVRTGSFVWAGGC